MMNRRRFSTLSLLAAGGVAHRCVAAAPASTALPNVQVLPQRFAMPGLDRERTLRLYLPPSYATNPTRRYPVIYLHDGQNLFDDATAYAGEWGVDETLNALAISHGFEAIAVGIDNGAERRINELSPWPNARFGPPEGERYLRFVVDTVKPFIDANYRTQPGRESTAVIGSSMGGLMSHYAIEREPAVFGKAGVFSPSYWISLGAAFEYTRTHPLPADARLYLSMGGREGDEAVADFERMKTLLAQQAPASRWQAHLAPQAEHNEAAWRRELVPALIWLFELTPRP